MANDKKREYGHNPIPAREEKGLQPIKPHPVLEDPSMTSGLQPVRPAPKNEGGAGTGGGEEKSGAGKE